MFRWWSVVVLLGCLGISSYYRRRAQRAGETISRRREGAPLMLARAGVALPLFLGVLVCLAYPPWMDWGSFALPAWMRWAGLALGSLAVPWAFWVFRSLGCNVSETVLTKQGHELVTHGPYRWIRHPLYATGLAMFLSIGLMSANWFILLWTLIALVAIRVVVIPREEGELRRAFGDAYERYAGRTGRLLPRVRASG